ncbi:MYG1 exonuclease-like isoform X2 [Temnothorax nylanderi]|uniref:MYG1 exonuclease-like isoform X2 n=1 Tax=Temnothorax nylanderi TaxID=102681 RepID=UPI003A8AE817
MSGKSTGTRIGTHDKTFRCSQVLACALLKLLPQYEDASIVRSQDQNILDTCDIVVDVGGVYDHFRHRYDHRMRYSSSCTDLSTRIYRLNPWSDSRDEEKDQQFEKAMALVREEFLEVVQNARHVDYPQTGFLQYAVGSRFVVDWSGEIIILRASVPASVLCADLLSYIEEDMNVSSSIKYIILDPTDCRNYDYYKVACIALRRYSEEYRMLLPREWAGLEYEALVEACGVECALRVDPDRRIGFVETLYGAIVMAREALKIGKTAQSEE